MTRKGIILAGGSGTRLLPTTSAIGKHLIPVYDKPMLYYPLCVLMLAGIREILIISSPRDLPMIEALLGNGHSWGLEIQYAVQEEPRGIADAFLVGRSFIANEAIALVLGDNIFFGQGLGTRLTDTAARNDPATVFVYRVGNPTEYGVVTLDPAGTPTHIEEKPQNPQSNYAVTGLYFYGSDVVERAAALAPSARGELEITEINRAYLDEGKLSVEILGRGVAWLDAGTSENLLRAGQFVETIEERQGFKICCPEEISWRKGFIDREALRALAKPLYASGYGRYLMDIVETVPDPTPTY
jgi:glucose-1-phosphate thymidylyltransferase